MKFDLRRVLIASAVSLAALAPLGAALAQSFPSKPITIVVPYPPGGANDNLGRWLGQKMSEALKVPVVIENKAGAGALIGGNHVAKAAPDGYTILVGGLATHAASPHLIKAEYNPLTDFEAVGLIGSAPIVANVGADSAYKNFGEIVAAAKKDPKAIFYGSSGNGSPLHLAGELFSSTYQVPMEHVPYKGGTAHTMDLIAGRIPVIFDTTTGSMSFIKGGKLRALAVTGLTRLPDLPNTPTFAEAGFPNFTFSAWYGMFAPAKTPKDVVTKLTAALQVALKDPDIISKLRNVGVTTASGSAEELAKLVPVEYKRIGDLIRSANIKAD